MKYKNSYGKEVDVPVGKIVSGVVAVIVILVLLFISVGAASKAYGRYQKRADAQNEVKVTAIQIDRAKQQAQINRAQIEATKAEAQKRIVEAEGIRKSQDLIAKTLTPLYVQYEAIKAAKESDKVYIPVGPQGIPIVANESLGK